MSTHNICISREIMKIFCGEIMEIFFGEIWEMS